MLIGNNLLGRKCARILSFRGRRSRNKVSVGEPAEGSLTYIYNPTPFKPWFSHTAGTEDVFLSPSPLDWFTSPRGRTSREGFSSAPGETKLYPCLLRWRSHLMMMRRQRKSRTTCQGASFSQKTTNQPELCLFRGERHQRKRTKKQL